MGLQFPVEAITVRPAEAKDAAWGADLLFSAGKGLFSYVFASTPEKAKETLYQAFTEPNHAFSYEYTQIVEVNDRAAGLILGYPGDLKRKLEENVQGIMAHLLPISRVPRILVNLADLSRIKQEVDLNDYFVLSLCIAPEFRNHGLGSALLQDTELEAQDLGCQHICTDVTYHNLRARKLFERLGYTITCSKTSHRFEAMTDAGGLHRLEKNLEKRS
ncbi:GNAT family N-acetyltransferase [Alkalinema sp. FACHB-956]|uniref:GNAT family N-acetyltransferase n=1 Tax=Alkalinema sp. FACHB-956 TaxID=2692768 RepID=UPI001689F9E7|nr:GNAT family N-acetyltransferase [Alkalinema sp. FACHB-956]MBD2327362.1 GNAT family N-acetyltransferase [Alkalinema sp. FACHB-956]